VLEQVRRIEEALGAHGIRDDDTRDDAQASGRSLTELRVSFTDVLSTLAATEEEKRAFLEKLSRAELARMLGLWELRGPRQRAPSCSDPSWTTWLFLGGRSPDRLDALVWALTHLMLGGAEPRVRVL
jgi:hypothetical protein